MGFNTDGNSKRRYPFLDFDPFCLSEITKLKGMIEGVNLKSPFLEPETKLLKGGDNQLGERQNALTLRKEWKLNNN